MRRPAIAVSLTLVLALAAAVSSGCSSAARVPPPGEAVEGTIGADGSTVVRDGSADALRAEQPTLGAGPVTADLLTHGPKGTMKVALTFDLCETPDDVTGFSRRIFDTLTQRRAAATFFMGGHWAQSHLAEAREIGAVPYFDIGNHTYAHMHATRITDAQFRDEIERCQTIIAEVTGRHPVLFRFPYGESDARTRRIVADEQLRAIQWNIEPGDPDPNVSGDQLVRTIVDSAKSGAIVVLHANNGGVHTAAALPYIIDELRGKGYELVTVSDMLTDEKAGN